MKGLARLFVATAAGAGMGAAAALAKRHLLAGHADGRTWAPPAQPTSWRPFDQEAHPVEAPATPVAAAAPAPPATPPPAPAAPSADIADLESARLRLRRRAAELRAEMEGRAGVP